MKRTVISVLLILALLCSLPFSASAAEDLPLIIDNADLLNSAEEASLDVTARELQEAYGLDIVILTIDSLEGQSAQAYADNYYDSQGYGCGDDASGILVLLAMEEREWYISTSGKAIYALTDYGIQEIGELMISYFDFGYESGFRMFLLSLPTYLDAYESGEPIDGYANYGEDYYHGDRETTVYYEAEHGPSIFLSLVIGIISATISIFVMRASMNSKRKQHGASGYLKSGSFHLSRHQDLFLYSNVTKVRRQQNTSSSGGGSSVHRSSGGRSHGGGGGKF